MLRREGGGQKYTRSSRRPRVLLATQARVCVARSRLAFTATPRKTANRGHYFGHKIFKNIVGIPLPVTVLIRHKFHF